MQYTAYLTEFEAVDAAAVSNRAKTTAMVKAVAAASVAASGGVSTAPTPDTAAAASRSGSSCSLACDVCGDRVPSSISFNSTPH